jgi:heterodisulfide reductase subunit A2
VGAGPAGLSAALALADLHIRVVVVEKSDRPGGNAVHIHDDELKEAVGALVQRAEQHPLITIYCGASVVSHRGLPGRFAAEISVAGGGKEVVAHGAVVLAVGGNPSETGAYGMGSHESVITQFDLERRLHAPENAFDPPGSVVMIQCAGSREEPNNYCSRICCAKALSNALLLKERQPDAKIWIFYRDIMTYGDLEKIYTRARAAGVFLIPFDPGQKPTVTVENATIVVAGRDPIMGEDIRLAPDLVALSTGVVPAPAGELSRIFGIRLTQDGFIREADAKWRPVDTGREGIFTAGLCRAPANARGAMAEGEAAAYRACRILGRARIGDQRHSARVRHAICSHCELCIEACPYDARYIDLREKKIMVDAAACQGCGACAAVCPNSASVLTDFEDSGILDAIEAAL